MRSFRLLAIEALALLAVVNPAAARDLTGPYVGVEAGAIGIEDSAQPFSIVATPIPDLFFGTVDGEGATIGGVAGYRWQFDGVIIGVEADADKISAAAEKSSALAGLSVEAKWSGTLRATAGVPIGNILVYATYGAAVGGFDFAYRLGTSAPTVLSEDLTGWTAGGGIEWTLGRLRPRIEYRKTEYGAFGHDPAVFRFNHQLEFSTFRAAVIIPIGRNG